MLGALAAEGDVEGPALARDVRTPLVALFEEEARRTRRSGWKFSAVSSGELVLGGVTLLTREQRPFGVVMVAGGLAQLVSGQYQINMGRRRYAASLARLAEVEGIQSGVVSLATSARRDADRQARQHAFGAGLYTALLAGGVATFATTSDPDRRSLGIGLGVTGLIGMVHHGFRWRASSRFSQDYDAVRHRIPMVVPDVRR